MERSRKTRKEAALDRLAAKCSQVPPQKSSELTENILQFVAKTADPRFKYVKKPKLAEEYGMSVKTVERCVKRMSQMVGERKRYSPYVILHPKGTMLILKEAFHDFLTNEEMLERGVSCPPWVSPFHRKYGMMSAAEISQRYSISKRTAQELLKEMYAFTGTHQRYPAGVIIMNKNTQVVREDCFIDFMKYRNLLMGKEDAPEWKGMLDT